ncbi:MAG: hypothetical protein FJ009_00155 [Chloroflexi bacterium]|nr:hypothetical protein [Chloroflexota bacterium]
MSSEMSRQVRQIVTAVVVIAALLMIVAVPLIVDGTLNPIIQGQLDRIAKFKAQGTPEGNAQAAVIQVVPWSIGFLFPLWAVLSLIAGFALLVIAPEFYRGAKWTRGVALAMLSIPSIGGAFMLIPWLNFVGTGGGFPPALWIMAIGLVPYFTVIFAEKSDWLTKAASALVFLMLGVTAAENFANGHASFRIYIGHPKRPLFAEGIPVLWLSFITLWITCFMLIVAIFQIGNRKMTGWYLAMVAGLATAVASGATHYYRSATNDYLYGALFGLSIVVLLVIPAVKKRLFEPNQ